MKLLRVTEGRWSMWLDLRSWALPISVNVDDGITISVLCFTLSVYR